MWRVSERDVSVCEICVCKREKESIDVCVGERSMRVSERSMWVRERCECVREKE